MNECKTSEITGQESLQNFVRRIKGNKYRLVKLEEDLDWVTYQLYYSIPGPNYERIGTPSNVRTDRMIILMDKEWKIKEKIKRILDEEKLLCLFEKTLTKNELSIFHLYYFKEYSQGEIASKRNVSQQCVSQYILKIIKKWECIHDKK